MIILKIGFARLLHPIQILKLVGVLENTWPKVAVCDGIEIRLPDICTSYPNMRLSFFSSKNLVSLFQTNVLLDEPRQCRVAWHNNLNIQGLLKSTPYSKIKYGTVRLP